MRLKDAILAFLKNADWVSRKEIISAVYPDFKKEYEAKDTFKTIVSRCLRELVNSEQIVKHKIQPLYLHSDYITLLNSRDSAESMMKHAKDLGIAHLPLSHLVSIPITKIPIIKNEKIEEENRKNLPFELKVLLDYSDGLSSIKIAEKYEEISNKTEAIKVIRKGLCILREQFKPKN